VVIDLGFCLRKFIAFNKGMENTLKLSCARKCNPLCPPAIILGTKHKGP
jgi:hypothetical protein